MTKMGQRDQRRSQTQSWEYRAVEEGIVGHKRRSHVEYLAKFLSTFWEDRRREKYVNEEHVNDRGQQNERYRGGME